MHFGDNVSILNALFISLFSIIFVFVLLWIISYLIQVISFVCKKFKFSKNEESGAKNNTKTSHNNENLDNDELIAVISAACLAENRGSDIKVNSIKESGSNIWLQKARSENIK